MTADETPDRDSAVASLDADPSSGAGTDASAELRRDFWRLVGLFNVALLGVSVGLMLIAFEGRVEVGAAALALGAGAFVAGVRRYRRRNA